MAVRRTALVLAYLACVSRGRRVQSSHMRLETESDPGSQHLRSEAAPDSNLDTQRRQTSPPFMTAVWPQASGRFVEGCKSMAAFARKATSSWWLPYQETTCRFLVLFGLAWSLASMVRKYQIWAHLSALLWTPVWKGTQEQMVKKICLEPQILKPVS
mmetsp:Transcript_141422/g.257046  ORF Transcript_141422/g.257046 Transcript_141422/m.257046 type:complete len:157 (-) Transcript_141422:232-702(-)